MKRWIRGIAVILYQHVQAEEEVEECPMIGHRLLKDQQASPLEEVADHFEGPMKTPEMLENIRKMDDVEKLRTKHRRGILQRSLVDREVQQFTGVGGHPGIRLHPIRLISDLACPNKKTSAGASDIKQATTAAITGESLQSHLVLFVGGMQALEIAHCPRAGSNVLVEILRAAVHRHEHIRFGQRIDEKEAAAPTSDDVIAPLEVVIAAENRRPD
jgi:hypothetical protein